MGERFGVVPVDSGGVVVGEGEHLEAAVADPAPDAGGGRRSGGCAAATGEEKDAPDDSVFVPQDPNAVVPILEYNREPNKYGRSSGTYTEAPCPTSYLFCLLED